MQHILYLHGFLSSPKSVKAQATKAYFEQNHSDVRLHIPELSNFPSKVEGQLLDLIESTPALLDDGLKLIGSSMGGYLSTFLLEQFGGTHENPYSKEQFEIVEGDIGVIKALEAESISDQARYKVLLQTEDETLDYRLAAEKYAQSHLVIEEGGDHSFVGYENHLPAIAEFLLK